MAVSITGINIFMSHAPTTWPLTPEASMFTRTALLLLLPLVLCTMEPQAASLLITPS